MKLLLTYSLLILSGFMLPSCGDDEDDKKQDPAPIAVEGGWNLINVHILSQDAIGNNIVNKNETFGYGNYLVNFNANNAYSETSGGSTKTGAYSIANNQVTINVQPVTFLNGSHNIDSLTAYRMVLREVETSGGATNTRTSTFKR